MEDKTWVKLYRKIADNDIIKDGAALQVFIFLLSHVNRANGEYTTGRFVLAGALAIKPDTAYKALKRLEKKYNVVTLSSNNRFTKITLIHWAKYQDRSDTVTQGGNNEVTTESQPSNTKQEYRSKNKDIRERERSLSFLQELPQEVAEELSGKYNAPPKVIVGKAEDLANYCVGHGKTYRNYRAMLLLALKRDFGLRPVSKQTPQPAVIDPAAQARVSAKISEFKSKFFAKGAQPT